VSKAAKLASWTRLSIEEFAATFRYAVPWGQEITWEFVVGIGDETPVLTACELAEEKDFLRQLALGVAKVERDHGRLPSEISQMLQDVASFGFLQGMTDQQKGFMSPEILLPLHENSKACVRIFRGRDEATRRPIGTGFLVRHDQVLTAAHVALEFVETADGTKKWSDNVWPDLSFEFQPSSRDPDAKAVIGFPDGTNPLLSFAKPHADPPKELKIDLAPPANDNLDFAFIQLAHPIQHLSPVDLEAAANGVSEKPCWVFGYPPGDQLVMDVDKIKKIDVDAGRYHHVANTAAGMSGGCCMNHLGRPLGVHEGTYEAFEGGERQVVNRGVMIHSIRAAQRAMGKDPLKLETSVNALEFMDDLMVADMYKAGLTHHPADLAATWHRHVEDTLDTDPDGSLPPFHPWFHRKQLEKWIDGDDIDERVCLISGERGTGKSFAVQILKAKAQQQGSNLLALNATHTSAMGWDDTISQAIKDANRTAAGRARYSDTNAVITGLRDGLNDPGGTQFVALDFGFPTEEPRLAGRPWLDLAKALAAQSWVKLLLIGLNMSDTNLFLDQLERDSLTVDVMPLQITFDHIDERDLRRYLRDLEKARGLETTNKARDAAQSAFDNMNDQAPAATTTAAALAAIAFERGLH